MATRGRKPKPTALKILHGDRADRIPVGEPRPAPGRPECPECLSAVAKAEWSRIVPKLEALGVLADIDGAALALYCATYARWRFAQEYIAKPGGMTTTTGNGSIKVSPWVQIAQQAETTMHRLLVEFGCTPSARSRVKVQSDGPKDELAEFLGKRRGS